MLLDSGVVAPADAALVGARNLDPPEVAFMRLRSVSLALVRLAHMPAASISAIGSR